MPEYIVAGYTAPGPGAVPAGAFSDSYFQNLLNIYENYIPPYIIPVGYAEY